MKERDDANFQNSVTSKNYLSSEMVKTEIIVWNLR